MLEHQILTWFGDFDFVAQRRRRLDLCNYKELNSIVIVWFWLMLKRHVVNSVTDGLPPCLGTSTCRSYKHTRVLRPWCSSSHVTPIFLFGWVQWVQSAKKITIKMSSSSSNVNLETRSPLDEVICFNKGGLFDLGHPLLNRIAESFVKASGVPSETPLTIHIYISQNWLWVRACMHICGNIGFFFYKY